MSEWKETKPNENQHTGIEILLWNITSEFVESGIPQYNGSAVTALKWMHAYAYTLQAILFSITSCRVWLKRRKKQHQAAHVLLHNISNLDARSFYVCDLVLLLLKLSITLASEAIRSS